MDSQNHDLADDSLHRLLTTVLPGGPDHMPMIDVAAVALARAGAADARLARLSRLARLTRFATAAAILLVAATIAVGYWVWPTVTTSTTAIAESASTANSTLDVSTMSISALLIGVVLFTLMAVFTPERPTYRLAMA